MEKVVHDVAILKCDDEDTILILSKIVEAVINETADKENVPMISVLIHLITANEKQSEEYFKRIAPQTPIDLGLVRLHLLAGRYKYMQNFVNDVLKSFEYYDYVRIQCPDYELKASITQASYTAFIQQMSNCPLLSFVDAPMDAILEEMRSAQVDGCTPIPVVGTDEARSFLMLIQTFSEQQQDQFENLIKNDLTPSHDYTMEGDHISLSLNSIYPTKCRHFMEKVRSDIATKEQLHNTKVRDDCVCAIAHDLEQDLQKE